MRAFRHLAFIAGAMLRLSLRGLLPAMAMSLLLAIFPAGAAYAQTDAATGVNITAPSTMAPGDTAYVTVTMRNTGTTTWYPGLSTNPYRLGSQLPADNQTWGVGRVELGSMVAPGAQATFGFTITAPSTPGTYNFGWAMLREGYHWFGNTISSSITVAVPPPVYDAQLVSASVPTSMTAGSNYNVSMTFKNTGNVTWTSPDYLLGNTDDNYTFGVNRVSMSASSVAPGQSTTFNFQISAPTTTGTYTFQWGMLWEFHRRFGQSSTTSITVSPASVPAPTINVSRPSLVAGQSFTTTWSTTNATSLTHVCTASGTGYTVNETLPLSGSGTQTAQSAWVGYPSSCTWTATGSGGLTSVYTEKMTTGAASGGSVTYIHTDGLGSPIARTDASGTVISRTRYEPYGYVASGVQPTIGFTGHVNDADTGLTYMQQRYYDPVAGRFLSIDPVNVDGNTGSSFNRYVYSNNNPYRFVDPDGRNSIDKFKALGLTVRNSHLTVHPVTGIAFRNGFPDFSSVAIATVQIKQTGTIADFAAANKLAGYAETPKGYTWHHHEDETTMQLVPSDIHAKTGHSGGASISRARAIAGAAAAAVVGDAGAEILMGEKEATPRNKSLAVQDFILNILPMIFTVGSAGEGSDKVPTGKTSTIHKPGEESSDK
jgi:RHS repeat-associated protein